MDKQKLTYRCPVSRCYGWVSYISVPDDRPIWGCGECGSVWHSTRNFLIEIEAIVNKFEYRRSCYVWISNDILPNDLSNEKEDYEEMVQTEPWDDFGRYDRDGECTNL